MIYGAKVGSIAPVGEDTYETTLSLDQDVVDDLGALSGINGESIIVMRFVAGLVSCCVGVCVWADGHQGAECGEQVLTAIKEQLVAEAQTAETQVTNTAWLDSDGRLHSTMIRSDVRVRGVQVHRYLENAPA